MARIPIVKPRTTISVIAKYAPGTSADAIQPLSRAATKRRPAIAVTVADQTIVRARSQLCSTTSSGEGLPRAWFCATNTMDSHTMVTPHSTSNDVPNDTAERVTAQTIRQVGTPTRTGTNAPIEPVGMRTARRSHRVGCAGGEVVMHTPQPRPD